MRPRGTFLVLPSYVIAAILLTWPVIRVFSRAIPSGHAAFDPVMQAFLLGWDWIALRTNPAGLFHPPIFHPETNTLTYMDHLIGEALAAAPAFALLGSVAAAYNFLFIGSFAASAWAVYRLTRLVGVSRWGAFLSGFLFAFSPYRFANIDLLNQLQTELLPIGLLFGFRYLDRYRTRDLVGVLATLVAQVYFGWYYACYLLLALVLLAFHAGMEGRLDLSRVRPAKTAAAVLAAALLAVPVLLPYMRERVALPEFHRTLGESALYSADVLDYATLNSNAAIARWVRAASGAQSYWPGLVTVVLGVIGVRSVWPGGAGSLGALVARMGARGYFLALSVAGFVLSLGPVLHVAGVRTWIPLPYSALYFLFPGFSGLRAPARLAVLALLGLAVLAGVGYDEARRRLLLRRRPRLVSRLVMGSIIAAAIVPALPRPLPTVELPEPGRMAPVYAWLAGQPDSPPILEIPVPARDADESETHSLRQYCLLLHGKPRLDGSSGFVSRAYREFRSIVQRFPDDDAVDAAARMGARLIIVHFGDYPPGPRDVLRRRIPLQPRLEPVARFGDDAVYRLRPQPGE